MSEHKCSECEVIFKSAPRLKRHLLETHHVRYSNVHSAYVRVYECDECSKYYSSQAKLETHKSSRHIGQMNYQCSLCLKEFLTKDVIKIHLKHFHQIDDDVIVNDEDDDSGEVTEVNSSMVPSRSSNYDRLYQCDQCGRMFKTADLLTSHRSSHNDAAKSSYQCLECTETFETKTMLKRHVKRVHQTNFPKEKSLKNKTFKLPNLKKTQYSLGGPSSLPKKEIIKCENCGLNFKSWVFRNNHLLDSPQCRENVLNGNYQKPANEIVSNNPDVMLLQAESEVEELEEPLQVDENVSCAECGLVFQTMIILVQHLLNSHQNTPEDASESKDITNIQALKELPPDNNSENNDITDASQIKEELLSDDDSDGKNITDSSQAQEMLPPDDNSERKDITESHAQKEVKSGSCCNCKNITNSQTQKKLPPKAPELQMPKDIRCEHCGEVFKTFVLRNTHLLNSPQCKEVIANKNKQVFSLQKRENCCKQCKLKAKPKPEKVPKVKVNRERIKCNYCKRVFISPKNLQNHIKRVHNSSDNKYTGTLVVITEFCGEAITIKCGLCGLAFSDNSQLNKHLLIHTRGYIVAESEMQHRVHYKCETCEKVFTTKLILEKHIQKHHIAKLSCPMCEKTFKRLSYLNFHLKTHRITGRPSAKSDLQVVEMNDVQLEVCQEIEIEVE